MLHRLPISLVCWWLACAPPLNALGAAPVVLSGPTMGTTYRVKLREFDAAAAPALQRAIDAALADIDQRLSTYRRDSEISRFNRAPAGAWCAVSPATAEFVAAALRLGDATDGALDITVGPLVRLWHFGPAAITDTRAAANLKPPEATQLAAARALVGHKHLEVRLDPPALRKRRTGVEIDLSAIGEGHAIDRLARLLAQHGCDNFLIELGGEVRARGIGPAGEPWRVAVAKPTADRAEAQLALPLNNAAIATSGDYRRYFEHEGRRYSHILDPATGRPIAHTLAAVTVVADDATTADAWDTALLVLGPQRGYAAACAHDIAALFIEREGAGFVVRPTPAWQQRCVTAASSSPVGPQTQSP